MIFFCGDIVEAVLRSCNKTGDKEFEKYVYRVMNIEYFKICRDHPWQALRDDVDWMAWEVARASMAAQTYFEPWKGYADGGLYLNDPVMATATALHQKLNWQYEDMDIFGIGTGIDGCNIQPPNVHNLFGWTMHIIDSMLRGGSIWTQRHFAKSMPFNRYLHVDFQRPDGLAFDDPDIIPQLKREWGLDIALAVKAINEF